MEGNGNLTKTAKEYVSEHNLENILSELMNSLVFENARKPEIFMVRYYE